MKIKILLITVFFTGALNAAYQDNWSTVDWRKAFQQRPDTLWQQDKKTIAELNSTDREVLQRNCPDLAQDVDRATIEKALNNHSDKNQLLFEAAFYNLPFIVEYLITHGADSNAKDNHGKRPLHWAARNNFVEIVQLLLEYDAKVDAKDDDGRTPLHAAAIFDSAQVVQLLIQACADTTIRDPYGRTAYDFATTDEIRQLIAHHEQLVPADKDMDDVVISNKRSGSTTSRKSKRLKTRRK